MKIARTKADMKRIVEQWKHAGPELEAFRRKELAAFDHARNWRLIDGLLDEQPSAAACRTNSGLVEMQRWFMKLARKQGILPATAREDAGAYGPDNSSRGVSPRPRTARAKARS